MEKEEEDGQEDVFSLLYLDGFNIPHCKKPLFFHLAFDPPNIKLCLPRSLNLLVFISHPTGLFGEMLNNPVLGKPPAFLYLQAGVGNLNQKC